MHGDQDPLPRIVGRHYRIEARVGTGGMGVVYRGTDTRLNRRVAIKAIHDSRLRGGGASRLRAEALAAAAIDHPYICKVYELVEEGHENFLVMEYAEGETLSHVLRRGAPALGDVVRWASEVAEGLAMAHARGIVHRDVKPSNVMISSDGHVKLLDFGLAREDVVAAPFANTRTSPSDHSAYAGTPQYMSPEQAAGEPVTARADLFSLGVLIFECLTGRLPFQGSSPYDYVRHLLTDRPRRLDRLAPDAPADLVALVERCLERAPADRPDSAATVLTELRRVATAITSTGVSFDTAGAVRAKQRWQATAAVVAGLAMAVVAWLLFFQTPPADPLRRSRALVTWPSQESGDRVSPDGRWVSFISTRDGTPQLYVQQIDGTDARALTLTAGRLLSHVWSPDSTRIACVIQRPDGSALQVFPAFFGGAAETTVPLDAFRAEPLRWIGRRIYLLTTSGDAQRSLQVVDLDEGTMTNLSESWTIDGTLLTLDVRPDARQVVAVVLTDNREDLWLSPVDAWRPERLTDDEFYEQRPVWSGTGQSIFYSTNRGGQDDLWEVVLSTRRHRPITSSQPEERAGGVSADGRLITFAQNADEARLWLIDPAGPTSRQLTADSLSDMAPSLSAAGDRIVFQRSEPSPSRGYQILNSRLLAADVADGALRGETRVLDDGFAGVLSPDGRYLAYRQRGGAPGVSALLLRRIDTDDVLPLSNAARMPVLSQMPMSWAEQLVTWSASGDAVYFVDGPAADQIRVYRPDDPSSPPRLLFSVPAGDVVRDLYLSPDDARLAFLAWSDNEFTLRSLDLRKDTIAELARLRARFSRLYGRGWLPDGRFVLTRIPGTYDDDSADVDVLVAAPGLVPAVAGTMPRGFHVTSRLDATRGRLYMTCVVDGVHNVYAMSLEDGRPVPVTDNALPGVTFSGIRPTPGGQLVVVRSERRRDIWLIEERGDRN